MAAALHTRRTVCHAITNRHAITRHWIAPSSCITTGLVFHRESYSVRSGNLITVRNEVAKVMFLHLSVILSMGGGCLPQWRGDTTSPREQTPLRSRPPPRSRHTPPEADTPWSRHPLGADTLPPPRRLPLWTVRILLDCILVGNICFNL